MKNFPFKYKGQEYWYSRANVCLTAVFCRDSKNELYVLINKRGTSTNNEQHKWNLPVGYLDFNETLKECAIREVYEETGISIDKSKITLFNINSKPDDSKQDIGFRFYALLDGTINDYIFSLSNMEHNEVEYVKWQNVNKLDEINWAWNHKQIVKKILNKVFNIET